MRKARYNELKRILEERRTEMLLEVHDKMRDVRKENSTVPQQGVRDEAESSEADIQEDIEFALLQMKAETLKKSEVTKTADDEYDDEWVQKTRRFLRERSPEEHHWASLCEYISKLSNGSPKRFCP